MIAKDPVCGMDVEETPDAPKATHQGQTFLFCSESCRARFEEAPLDFVDPGRDVS